jgi:hypothetical protein
MASEKFLAIDVPAAVTEAALGTPSRMAVRTAGLTAADATSRFRGINTTLRSLGRTQRLRGSPSPTVSSSAWQNVSYGSGLRPGWPALPSDGFGEAGDRCGMTGPSFSLSTAFATCRQCVTGPDSAALPAGCRFTPW